MDVSNITNIKSAPNLLDLIFGLKPDNIVEYTGESKHDYANGEHAVILNKLNNGYFYVKFLNTGHITDIHQSKLKKVS